ncbi:hypothetical protein [Bacillus thuringiensis]|uniref:Uncharacterized protein n=1 Tax=Bacillus thuringiensis serovar andalousiensis TaxID=257985 RepID=A0A7U1GDZ6_BACTU|nr:hypothetical protein [Bacillus thuringiensis]QQY96010.1 hypothetical protein EVG22_32445 [Bacillus thuringiensis serovar andalousiensis]
MNTIKKLFLSSMVCILLFSTLGTAYAGVAPHRYQANRTGCPQNEIPMFKKNCTSNC